MGRERERSDVVVVKLNALAVLRQRGRMLEKKNGRMLMRHIMEYTRAESRDRDAKC